MLDVNHLCSNVHEAAEWCDSVNRPAVLVQYCSSTLGAWNADRLKRNENDHRARQTTRPYKATEITEESLMAQGRAPTFGVIGAGIIGLAVARELLHQFPDASVTVFDKAPKVAAHQTGHNSGVVHAGLYYEPGSLKARLCRRGVALLSDYARSRNLPYEACGKLVVALRPEEHDRLRAISQRAMANGVPDVELIGPDRIRQLEPNA